MSCVTTQAIRSQNCPIDMPQLEEVRSVALGFCMPEFSPKLVDYGECEGHELKTHDAGRRGQWFMVQSVFDSRVDSPWPVGRDPLERIAFAGLGTD
jgi:hypothetical protein